MTYKLVFRVRWVYFNAIEQGAKDVEVRKDKLFWEVRAIRAQSCLDKGEEVICVFICGKKRHDRFLEFTRFYDNPAKVLGREPSAQGKRDIGRSHCIGFHLGDEVKERM